MKSSVLMFRIEVILQVYTDVLVALSVSDTAICCVCFARGVSAHLSPALNTCCSSGHFFTFRAVQIFCKGKSVIILTSPTERLHRATLCCQSLSDGVWRRDLPQKVLDWIKFVQRNMSHKKIQICVHIEKHNFTSI